MECHGHLYEDWEIRWNSYLDTRRIDLFTPEKCVFVWSFNVSFKLWPHVLRQNGLKQFTNHICPGAFHQYEYNITAGLSSIFWSTKSVLSLPVSHLTSSPTSETNAWWKKRFDAASLVTGQSTGLFSGSPSGGTLGSGAGSSLGYPLLCGSTGTGKPGCMQRWRLWYCVTWWWALWFIYIISKYINYLLYTHNYV